MSATQLLVTVMEKNGVVRRGLTEERRAKLAFHARMYKARELDSRFVRDQRRAP